MQPIIAIDDSLQGLSLTEWGFVGALVFVLVSAFWILLKHVLSQAAEDRDLFRKTSEANLKAIQEVTLAITTMRTEIERMREELEKLK